MNKYQFFIIILCIVFAIAILGALNVAGIGEALAGAGGATASGIVGGLAGFLTWGGAGGGPTVGVVYLSLLITGFIVGGLIMRGINKLRNKQAAALPVYQQQPTTVIPITRLQSEPTPAPTPAPPAEKKVEA